MALKSKDYKKWMGVKARLQENAVNEDYRNSYREGDIYWVSIGENVGYEEDGKGELYLRPVLVLSGRTKTLFLGVPLSSKQKYGKWYYQFSLPRQDFPSTAMLNQAQTIDTARIVGKRVAYIEKRDLIILKALFRDSI